MKGDSKRARVRNPQHGAGRLEAVSDAHTWLRLAGNRETVVQIAADTDIEEPVPGLDLILNIQSQFLYIGVTEIAVKAASTCQVVRRENRIVGAGRVHCRIIGYKAKPSALRGIGKSRLRNAVGVDAWRVVGGVDDAKTVILTQERLLVDRTHLDVVDSLLVGKI